MGGGGESRSWGRVGPGEGGGAGSGVARREVGTVAPSPVNCEVRGRGRAGGFQPGRPNAAAAAAADVEERSAEAGARRPLLFI